MLSPRGTPTVAPVSGTVSHRGNGIGGLSWHLNGDDGNYYYGTHLDSYANVGAGRSEEHTSELQSLMRISYAVFCLKNKKHTLTNTYRNNTRLHHDYHKLT